MRPTPAVIDVISSDKFYSRALEIAVKEKPDAKLCSLSLWRDADERKLRYSAEMSFYSPRDLNWHQSVSIWTADTTFGPQLRLQADVDTEPTLFWLNCSRDLGYPIVDNLEAIESMQAVGGQEMSEYVEIWPEMLTLTESLEGNTLWQGDFSYREHSLNTLHIVILVDGSTSEVISISAYDPLGRWR